MEWMKFDYDDYLASSLEYPRNFKCSGTLNIAIIKEWQDRNPFDNTIEHVFDRLKIRTTDEYYSKIFGAQWRALAYSEKSFPAYEFMLPECLADDWLSTMDWHKKYNTRDHSLHQPLTAYIAMKLLGYGDPNKSLATPAGPLLSLCVDSFLNSKKAEYLTDYFSTIYPKFNDWDEGKKKQWATDLFYEATVLSALFHDMGYPWQFVNRLDDHIGLASYKEFVMNVDELNSEREKNGKLILDFVKDQLLRWPLYGYVKHSEGQETNSDGVNLVDKLPEWFRNTHGFPGAIGFVSLNKKTRVFPAEPTLIEASQRFILDWAAVGIMMHDMAGVYQKDGNIRNRFFRLSLDTDPLSCIIALSDVLEEFERPKAYFDKKKVNHVDVSYGFECVQTKIKVDENNCIRINYVYDKEIDQKSKERRKKEVREYLNPVNGFIDLSMCGITNQDCNIEEPQPGNDNSAKEQ